MITSSNTRLRTGRVGKSEIGMLQVGDISYRRNHEASVCLRTDVMLTEVDGLEGVDAQIGRDLVSDEG